MEFFISFIVDNYGKTTKINYGNLFLVPKIYIKMVEREALCILSSSSLTQHKMLMDRNFIHEDENCLYRSTRPSLNQNLRGILN
jgi:hypothetical protein